MFPARRLGGASSGGGEWLVAFRTAERERFQAILSCFPRSVSQPSRRNINTPMSDSFRPLVFSRPLLLEMHGVSSPQDLCVARVSGLGLSEWNEESDLDTFVNLVEIDASDNALQLEAFYPLNSLRRLDLSVNQISNVTLREDNLTRLQTLDLSGNSISSESLLSIGLLVSLTELHLSGNELDNLPEEMARQLISVDSFGVVTSQRNRFPLLQKLWLDNNLLEDVRIFAVLAGLKKLEYLNLSHNRVFSLPHLHFLPKELIERLEEETLRDNEQQGRVNTDNSAGERTEVSSDYKRGPLHNTGDSDMENLAKILSDISVISRFSPKRNTTSVPIPDPGETSNRPYPALLELDLSCNQIYYPEDVVACAKWRSLKYLRLQGNPITCQQRGVPSILQRELVERGKQVTMIDDSVAGERAKKRANKLAAVAGNTAPLKIAETLPPLPAKRMLPLTLQRDDAYSQPSSVTPISQARTYPGNFPRDSGTSLLPSLPYLPSQERRPCTVVTGKMNELMSPDKHRRPTLDTDSQSSPPTLQTEAPSRETFFMTQSERDPREETGLESESALGAISLAAREQQREERAYDLLPSECVEELREIFQKDEDEVSIGAELCYRNINASTRQLSYLLQHPLSLPGLSHELSCPPAPLEVRYKHCLQRKGRCPQTQDTKAITHKTNAAKQEVEVDYSLERAMRRGGEKERREVSKLFASLQQKYNKLRTSHYHDDTKETHIPLSTSIQNPQVY